VTTHFYLIDFENVQPKALDRLKPGTCQIKVFLGQQQTRLLLELVQALQPFGSDAEYIQIQGSGPDAVDFHIAFYIGRLAAAHPGATFDIISKDKGFDPLVRHMAKLGIGCRRLADIPGIRACRARGRDAGQERACCQNHHPGQGQGEARGAGQVQGGEERDGHRAARGARRGRTEGRQGGDRECHDHPRPRGRGRRPPQEVEQAGEAVDAALVDHCVVQAGARRQGGGCGDR